MAKTDDNVVVKPEVDRGKLHVPMDLVNDIFFKLPIDTLVRMRGVHPTWMSWIESKEFVDKHLRKIEDPSCRHRLIINNHRIKCVDLENLTECVDMDKLLNETTMLGGVCCGVFLLVGHETGALAVFNPTTKKAYLLPSLEDPKSFAVYGLGFNDDRDDYKVIELGDNELEEGSDHPVIGVRVYSMKSNSWRSTGNLPKDIALVDSVHGVYVAGALHWVFGDREGEAEYLIGSINLATELYQPVPLPDFTDPAIENMNLGELNGHLCLSCNYTTTVDLWYMQEYTVQKSWTKVFTFPRLEEGVALPSLIPITLSSEEIVVVQDYKQINWSQLKDGPQSRTWQIPDECEALPYVPTLLPVCGFKNERLK